MAVIKERLFVGDTLGSCVRVLDAATGKQLSQFSGEGTNKLDAEAGENFAAIGVAATPEGNLVVCDAKCVREFTPDGTFIRKIVDVNNGMAVAVDAQGNTAVAIVRAADKDYGYTPEVWKFDKAGKPVFRIVRVYMSGPQPDPAFRLNYFCGMNGRLTTPGGVAFDDDGNLYVSDFNQWLKQKGEFYGPTAYSDGGVIKVAPNGDIISRLGSRYDPALIKQRLADRAERDPLQRTAAAIKAGKLVMLAWGDSITQTGAGWNGGASKTELNWVHVLARKMETKFPALKVQEEANGAGGQNVAEGHTRNPVPWIYRQPDLILLEFGANDIGWHHYPPARYAQALREMVTDLLVFTDSDVVLMTPGLLPGKQEEEEKAYIQAEISVGKEMGVPVINMTDGMAGRLATDNVPYETYHLGADNCHPNDAGHAVWADIVLEGLAKELADQAR